MGKALLIYVMAMKDAGQRNVANRADRMGKRHTDCPTQPHCSSTGRWRGFQSKSIVLSPSNRTIENKSLCTQRVTVLSIQLGAFLLPESIPTALPGGDGRCVLVPRSIHEESLQFVPLPTHRPLRIKVSELQEEELTRSRNVEEI